MGILDGIVDIVLKIGGTPYKWIMDSELSALSFADFNSTILPSPTIWLTRLKWRNGPTKQLQPEVHSGLSADIPILLWD